MKKLGFGLMRLPLQETSDQTSIDIGRFKQMVDKYLDSGFKYFDTAYPYHGGKSELAFQEAVSKRYTRDKYEICDKLPCWEISCSDDMERIFEEQLCRCGVDYFDYYLLHCLNPENVSKMDRYDGWGFLNHKKEEGKIRNIGFSFHSDSQLLEELLQNHPEIDYVQLQINYLDWESTTVDSRRCYELCVKYNKPVIVMEPVKGGSLSIVPSEVETLFRSYNPSASPTSWAIRYCATLPNVHMVLSGMSTLSHIDDNVSYMSDFKPINPEESSIINEARRIISESIVIPCTSCHYCSNGCPMKICIPEYFHLYNTIYKFGKESQLINTSNYYNALSIHHGKANQCIECGLCEEHCPQHILIIDSLQLVSQIFDTKSVPA